MEAKKAETLEEVQEAREVLSEYLAFTKCPPFQVAVAGKKGEYGLIVYISERVDTTFIIPLEVDGAMVRVCHVKKMPYLDHEEIAAIANWYDTHCSVSGNPIIEGPCNMCHKLGFWEVDPFLEDCHGKEVWNFWCALCYESRSNEI